jgi:hypothetical protein
MATEIFDWNDLQAVSNDLTGDYLLANDLDENTSGYTTNFTPLGDGKFGDRGQTPFSGTFDGQNNIIYDLQLESVSSGNALFGASTGIIENLGLSDFFIDTSESAGGIVYENRGIIRNCFSIGIFKNSLSFGAISNSNYGNSTSSVIIEDCYGVVSSPSDTTNIGGIIDDNEGHRGDSSNVLVERSYGVVHTPKEGISTAPLVGANEGGDALLDQDGTDAVIRDSYGDTELDYPPVVQENIDGEDDSDDTGIGGNAILDNVQGLTTSEMTGSSASSNMSALDFTNYFTTSSEYPVLSSFDTTAQVNSQQRNILSDAFEDVTIDSTNSPITEGQTLTVDYTVTNTGEQESDTNIELIAGGQVRDNETLLLSAGETYSSSFNWATQSGDDSIGTISVSSNDETESQSVTIETDSVYNVNITSTNSPITVGETIDVTADINNTGSSGDTKTVELVAGGVVRDSKSVAVSSGSTITETFNWTTQSGDDNISLVTIQSEDDEDSSSVEINQKAFFDIVIEETNSPIFAGADFQADVTIQNTGGSQDQQTIELLVDSVVEDSVTRTLDGGVSTTETLSWSTSSTDLGTYNGVVQSNDDSESFTIEVSDSGVSVTIDSTNSPVSVGETLSVDFTIENTTTATKQTEVELIADGIERDNLYYELSSGQTLSNTLTWDTQRGDHTISSITVTSVDNNKSQNVTIQSDIFDLNITSTNSPVSKTEVVDVAFDVTNIGDIQGNQTVKLFIDGSEQDGENLSLTPSSSQSVTLSWNTTDSTPAGTYEAEVRSLDDVDLQNVDVQSKVFFDISIQSTNSPIGENDSFEVTYSVQNTGIETGERKAVFEVDGEVLDVETYNLNAGSSTQKTITFDPDNI